MRVRGNWRSGPARVFRVNGIKYAVLRVVWIERDRNDARAGTGAGIELREDIRKSDIRREFSSGLVEGVKDPVQVIHEETGRRERSVCRLGAHCVYARQHTLIIDGRRIRALAHHTR